MLNTDHLSVHQRDLAESRAAYKVIEVGDYINVVRWFGDIWGEVVSVSDAISDHSFCWVTYWSNVGEKDMMTTDRVRKVHKRGDPWDFREAGKVFTKDGGMSGGDFAYKGTFTLKPWLWNYHGRNCMPKKAKDVSEWAKKAGVSLTGVPWDEADAVINTLQGIRIKGWHPILEKVSEVRYRKAIYPDY